MVQLALVDEGRPHIPNQIEQIFQHHAGTVFRTAYRITGNAADAEDVLQTVFVRLLGRGPGSGELVNPESYLRRAAVNVSLDVVRERQKAAEDPMEESPLLAAKSDPGELRDWLRQALGRLDARQAEIFALRFIEGYSNGEIARMLGISSVLVGVTLFRARRRLQQEFRARM